MAALEREGVDVSTVQRTPEAPTGIMIKERPSDHHTEVAYYRARSAAAQLEEADAPGRAVSKARLVHLTGISMAIGPGPAALSHRVIRDAEECGVPVSFDPNFRPSLIDEAAAVAVYRAALPSIDHLLCNEAEAMMIAGTATPESALEVLRGTGPTTVVIKQGAHGILAEIDGVQYSQPAYPAPNPVDPVGAGDAFNAGWIHAMLGGLSMQRALELGAFVASQVVQHPGDYEGFPDAARLEKWTRAQPANETEGALLA
jgi:2-dehydro-3-deoxygluconokinase